MTVNPGGLLSNKRKLFVGLNNLGKPLDTFMVQLINCGTYPVRITGVELTKLDGYSLPQFGGAFVAPSSARMGVWIAKDRPNLSPVNGFVLQPLKKEGDEPILVIRVEAAKPGDAGGFGASQNRHVVLTYRTADGSSHTAEYNTRFGIPNK
jgi:hypothetical protein